MRSVSVKELKDDPGRYLDEVLAGEEVLIEDQDQPVAKIIPFDAEDEDEEFDEYLAQLIAEGRARPPIGPLAPEFWTEPPIKISANELVALVSEDRDED
jgi:antitoxin (DNA-binding transcriptional repressor) of toxin-antitoxin stability system